MYQKCNNEDREREREDRESLRIRGLRSGSGFLTSISDLSVIPQDVSVQWQQIVVRTELKQGDEGSIKPELTRAPRQPMSRLMRTSSQLLDAIVITQHICVEGSCSLIDEFID